MYRKCLLCGLTHEKLAEYQLESENFTLFPIPIDNLLISSEWIEFIGETVMIREGDMICSMHFLPQDFVRYSDNRRKLRKDAIPSVHVKFVDDNAKLQVPRPSKVYQNVCSFCLKSQAPDSEFIKFDDKQKKLYFILTGEQLVENSSISLKSCQHCKETFTIISNYRNQLLENKNKLAEMLNINNHRMQFNTKIEIAPHVIKDVNDPSNDIWHCDLCSKSYNTKKKMAVHMKNSHIKELKFKCTIDNCTKAFYASHHLKNHIRVHTGDKPFACTEANCTARFSEKYFLDSHMKKHRGESEYRCVNCSSPYFTAKQLKTHETRCRGIFKPLRPYKYEGRNKFRDESEAPRAKKKYVYERNAEKYKCRVPSCSAAYRVKNKLKEHLKNFHDIEMNRRTTCIACYLNFNEVDALHEHCRRDHREFFKYPCQVENCNRTFWKLEFLKRHQLHHRESLPYECSMESCTMRFQTEIALKTHERHHYSDSLICTKCKEKSGNLNSFKVHIISCSLEDDIIENLEDE